MNVGWVGADGVREPREAELHHGYGRDLREAYVQDSLDTTPSSLQCWTTGAGGWGDNLGRK